MRIFLAGSESVDHSEVLAALKYPYRLCSYLAMRDGEKSRQAILQYANDGSEWIMDSGLFSFMFGSRKGELKTRQDYWAYAERYLREADEWHWPHVIVECDVQRVLDVGTCNDLRDQLFRKSGREVMYVWHLPEGEGGLRELASRELRIALSVPELRAVYSGGGFSGGQKVRAALIRLLAIIRESDGPAGQQVHLLGNTERVLLTLPADTCDSTSWIAAGQWGIGAFSGIWIFILAPPLRARSTIFRPTAPSGHHGVLGASNMSL